MSKETLLTKIKNIIEKSNTKEMDDELNSLYTYVQFAKINTIEKKPRTKNSIDPSSQCKALRADGERCSRKKKDNEYCGTHIKGRPHGEFNIIEPEKHKMIQVFSVDINGIVYWIDDKYNVYDTVAIMENKPNPKIINTCEKIIEGTAHRYRLKN